MYLLENTIQPYAWGSRTAIAELLGQSVPSPVPQAEVWMGAHPGAPSRVRVEGTGVSLADLIERSPELELGPTALGLFGPRLPFLLKVLAAETPLSLQAHPTLAQARAGFDAEEARGIARGAPDRNYKDPNHKPELICALSPFEALCGFRPVAKTLELFDALSIEPLAPWLEPLRRTPSPDTLRAVFVRLMQAEPEVRRTLVDATLSAATRSRSFEDECRWAHRLGELYPGDIGVVTMLLLNYVRLEPGEAIYLRAGNLHAYLGGVGVEIMASSDNVLRGGLTPKHVDVAELVRILDFTPRSVPKVAPETSGALATYTTEAKEFELSRVDLRGATAFRAEHRHGPEILLVTEGLLSIKNARGATLALSRGQSAFLSAADGTYALRGPAVAYRAAVGQP